MTVQDTASVLMVLFLRPTSRVTARLSDPTGPRIGFSSGEMTIAGQTRCRSPADEDKEDGE
jgi:hypothetical protein